VISVKPTNRLVDRTDPAINAAIAADPTVRNIVSGYNALVSPLSSAVVATIATALPSTANGAGEEPAGDLIADAQLAATQPAALGGAQIAFMNVGGVRSPGFVSAANAYPYALTYGDAFTVQPFGNSLVTMTVTATQLKALLEQQFNGCAGQTANRVMQSSNGLKYSWSAAAPACSKIVDASFTPTDVTVTPPVVTGPTEVIVSGGVVQNPGKTYRITVNNFMATGGDGFAVLLGGTSVQGGAQDIDALVAYLANYKSPKPAYDPSLASMAIPRVTLLP
jgi:5'-nucleotidase